MPHFLIKQYNDKTGQIGLGLTKKIINILIDRRR